MALKEKSENHKSFIKERKYYTSTLERFYDPKAAALTVLLSGKENVYGHFSCLEGRRNEIGLPLGCPSLPKR